MPVNLDSWTVEELIFVTVKTPELKLIVPGDTLKPVALKVSQFASRLPLVITSFFILIFELALIVAPELPTHRLFITSANNAVLIGPELVVPDCSVTLPSSAYAVVPIINSSPVIRAKIENNLCLIDILFFEIKLIVN